MSQFDIIFIASICHYLQFKWNRHCVKKVRIRNYSGPHFNAFGIEYLRIQTLFMQWNVPFWRYSQIMWPIADCSLTQSLFTYLEHCSNPPFNPLSANITKWSNALKQFVGNLPTNCLSVFDHFVGVALKGLTQIRAKVTPRKFRGLCLKGFGDLAKDCNFSRSHDDSKNVFVNTSKVNCFLFFY